MSSSDASSSPEPLPETKKRKRESNEEELEIDLNAPEPPSKKALRKAKKDGPLKAAIGKDQDGRSVEKVAGAEDVVPNRGKRSEYGIWIGNLSFATTKQDLLDFMTGDTEYSIRQDDVTRINLPAGSAKFGKFQNKGFAYIDLADDATLQCALQLSEKLLAGRRVLIKNANSFEGRPKEAVKESTGNPPSKRIFIGNLDFNTTVEDLEKHFGVCGPIHHTQMATFEDSGKCKGYAWVDFEQISSGQAAMRGWVEESPQTASQDARRSRQRIWLSKMNGRKLRLEFAEDKTTRYNKRFTKKHLQENGNDATPAIEEVDDRGADTNKPSENTKDSRPRQGVKSDQVSGGKRRPQRYADETVKKLTGAIVEGQGQKVTFD